MQLSRTALEIYSPGQPFIRPIGVKSGVSLHSHTNCSRETLEFVPALAQCIPLIATLFERSVAAYQRDRGEPPDFAAIYWRPPVTPAAVAVSEREQIAARFHCRALVSLTDHDTFEAPLKLRAVAADVPLSIEWTVPVEQTVLHLGVHGVPFSRLDETRRILAACTRGDVPLRQLTDVLAWLVEPRETFIVLNHPLWDLNGLGGLRHESLVLGFLHAHRAYIHALEINGYRRWAENTRVLPLAEGFALPIVAGGDRHGRAPNAMINLTPAASFGEFAAELRAGRRTHCVIFPEYGEPFAARVLQAAREALGSDDATADSWCERVFWKNEQDLEMSLASLWPTGGPVWLRSAVAITRLLGSRRMRPLLRLTLSGEA